MKKEYDTWYAKNIGVLGTDHHKEWFAVWKASRETLEISLPSLVDPSYFDCIRATGVGYNEAVKACRKAIKAQGLKVKTC